MYQTLADAVLLLHTAVVLFVVGGLVLVVLGNLRGWQWVNRLWFRLLHLGAIGTVVAQAWWGVTCPLTTLESWLRAQAGGAGYQAGFIEHWLQRLLFYEAPGWVFTLAYSLFGLLVLASWWIFPPRWGQRPQRPGPQPH
jgi:polyferredoxin